MNKTLLLLLTLMLWAPHLLGNDLAPALEAVEARNFDTAIEKLERVVEDRETENRVTRDALFHLALVQYRTAAFEDAEDTLEDLLDTHPADADAHYLTGLVHLALLGEVSIFRKVGMAKKALADWHAALESDPDHLNSRFAIFAYYVNAPSIAGGSEEKALELHEELARRDAAYGTMSKALLLGKQEDFEGAEAAYKEAITLMNRAGPHFSLAQFYMQQESWQKAKVEAEHYLTGDEKKWWDPDITIAHLIIARANAKMGLAEQARRAIELGLSLKPNRRIRELFEETLSSL